MITNLTAEDLIRFEDEVAELFKQKKIRAVIHLYHGCEERMLEIFQNVKPEDWVMCSWRSHYQCLLKGVPPEELKQEIIEGRSISLCFPKYNIVSSGIVGGILPIAVGVAMKLAMTGTPGKVHCFMGDMTSETGIAHECIKYSEANNLPIKFYIEDNGKSVCTDTLKAWGLPELTYYGYQPDNVEFSQYKLEKYPHAGTGERIQF
jgi:TPP-dependent pyruvate/acetoin dehydrogenase alpha subunit